MVTKAERRWILTVSILALIVTSTPYFIGFMTQGGDWRFTGFVFGADDGNSYIAKMLSGAAGDWLFRTPYTAYPQQGFLAFLPYLLLGKLTSAPGQHEQLIALFQIFRWVGGVLMLLATYDFISFFVAEIRFRKWGTLLACFGGGLGWLVVVGLKDILWGTRIPLEFYSPESFGFLSFWGLPHLACARAFLLWGMLFFLSDRTDNKTMLKGGLCWSGVGLMQPLTVLLGWAAAGFYMVLWWLKIRFSKGAKTQSIELIRDWELRLRVLIGMGICSSPVVIYTFLSFMLDPFLVGWGKQNIILSPPPMDYLLAYGPCLLLIGYGFWKKRQDGIKPAERLLFSWLILLPLFIYFPYNLQRRMAEGGWVVLITLSLLSIQKLNLHRSRWLVGFAGTSFLPALILLAGSIGAVLTPTTPLFRTANEVETFQFLVNESRVGDVLLAPFGISNAAPAWAPLKVVIGHGPESVDLADLQPKVDAICKITPSERAKLFSNFNVRWVLFDKTSQTPCTLTLRVDGFEISYENKNIILLERIR
jgi:hypothetical protein